MDRDISRILNPFIPLLLSLTVEEICPETHVFSINAYNTIEELSHILRSHTIHSVPVLENGTCIGMVDSLDIARFYFQDPQSFQHRIKSTKVISLILSNRAQLPVFSRTTLLDVISIVAPGVHRAVVLRSESDHSLFSVCSESDIIAVLHSYAQLQNPPPKNSAEQRVIKDMPVHLVCSMPICLFSNYLARIKFHVDSTDSIQNAIEHITKALQSTTEQQLAGAVVTPHSHPNLLSSDSESTQNDVEIIIDHPSLEWNAPIVVVVNQAEQAIVGYLNSSTLHTNLIQTKDISNLSSNYEKTIQDYLATFHVPGSSNINRSLGFVVKHTITFGVLMKLFTEYKLDYVWVFTRSKLATTAVPDMRVVIEDVCWELKHTIPVEWYTSNSLAMITINDLLRLISRDNISLYTRLIPSLAPTIVIHEDHR